METKKQQPFFAKFLEAQTKTVVPAEQQSDITKKIFDDHHDETMKYPSDGDEEGA